MKKVLMAGVMLCTLTAASANADNMMIPACYKHPFNFTKSCCIAQVLENASHARFDWEYKLRLEGGLEMCKRAEEDMD